VDFAATSLACAAASAPGPLASGYGTDTAGAGAAGRRSGIFGAVVRGFFVVVASGRMYAFIGLIFFSF